MPMTKLEQAGKRQIMRKLSEQGYPTYASILDKFQLNITHDPNALGYMEPNKGRIVINGNLDVKYMSVIVRHEILHFYLEHEKRLLQHLAEERGLNKGVYTDTDLDDLKRELYKDDTFNYAADYEISNRGYTDEDKDLQRNIIFNGEQLTALVTEDDHPDWVDKSVEEMYDLLRAERQKSQNDAKDNQEQNSDEEDESDSDGEGDSESDDKSEQSKQSKGSGKSKSKDSNKDSDDTEQSNNSKGGKQSTDKQGSKGNNSSPEENNSNGKDDSEQNSSNSEHGGQMSHRSPKIGDKGDDEIQAEEEAERAKKAAEEIGNAETPEEEQEAIEAAAKAIQDAIDSLNDPTTKAQIERETREAIAKEDRAKVEREIKKYKESSDYKLKMSLDRFIKKVTDTDRDGTWRKFNKTYANSSIIKKGVATVDAPIPLLNVYFDQSGSWGEDDIKVGQKSLGVLRKFVNAGQLKIKTYYFANNVHTDAADARREGGTEGPPVIEHIKQTRPDNVLIMTDSDFDYGPDLDTTNLPGAVWMLFRRKQSEKLKAALHGKRETHIMDLED